jgi:tetratricopeptide (TPR) repeat protein
VHPHDDLEIRDLTMLGLLVTRIASVSPVGVSRCGKALSSCRAGVPSTFRQWERTQRLAGTPFAPSRLGSGRRFFNTRLGSSKAARSGKSGKGGKEGGDTRTWVDFFENEARWGFGILFLGGVGVLIYQSGGMSPGFRERKTADAISRARKFEEDDRMNLALHTYKLALDTTHDENAKLRLSYKLAFMHEDTNENAEAERLFTVAAEMADASIKSSSGLDGEDGPDMSLEAKRRRIVSRDRLAQYSHDRGQHQRAENLYTSALDAVCTPAEFTRATSGNGPSPPKGSWWRRGSTAVKEDEVEAPSSPIGQGSFSRAAHGGGPIGVASLADEVAGVLHNMANLYAETGRLDAALGVLDKFKTVCTRYTIKNREERMAEVEKLLGEIQEAKNSSA